MFFQQVGKIEIKLESKGLGLECPVDFVWSLENMFCECWLTGNRCETNDNTVWWPTLPAAWCSLGCLAMISSRVHVTCVQQVGAQKKEPVFQIRYKINIRFLLLRHNQGYFVWEFEGKCMFWGHSTILNMKSMKKKRNLSQFEHHIYILTFLPFNVNCSLQHIWLSLNYYEPKAIFIVGCVFLNITSHESLMIRNI